MSKPFSDAAVAHKLREALESAHRFAQILRERGYTVEIQMHEPVAPGLWALITKTEHVTL